MKNFLDLLDTDTALEVVILTEQDQRTVSWPLLQPLHLAVKNATSIKVDGVEIVDFGNRQGTDWVITLDVPFYRWLHQVTGQGWLLDPCYSISSRVQR